MSKIRRRLPTKAADEQTEDMDEAGHARVGDPILPPARMLNVAFTAGTAESDNASSSSRGDSILSRLYDPDRKQRPELWAVSFSGDRGARKCAVSELSTKK
jgi:hypothetical protein